MSEVRKVPFKIWIMQSATRNAESTKRKMKFNVWARAPKKKFGMKML